MWTLQISCPWVCQGRWGTQRFRLRDEVRQSRRHCPDEAGREVRSSRLSYTQVLQRWKARRICRFVVFIFARCIVYFLFDEVVVNVHPRAAELYFPLKFDYCSKRFSYFPNTYLWFVSQILYFCEGQKSLLSREFYVYEILWNVVFKNWHATKKLIKQFQNSLTYSSNICFCCLFWNWCKLEILGKCPVVALNCLSKLPTYTSTWKI